MSDWQLICANERSLHVHTAIIGTGPRCSEVLRAQISRWQMGGRRETNLAQLLPENVSEVAIESALDWIYLGACVRQCVAAEQPKPPFAADAKSRFSPGSPLYPPMDRLEVAASGGASSLTEEAPDSLQSGAASRRSSFSYSTDEEGHGATAGATRDDVELWLVADVLDVQGLKAQLLPRFEALPQLDRYYNFKEESAAATLALCHHACALGCVKLAAALCVNLRVRVINNETSSMETMQEHIVPLYLAACLCDPPLQAQYGTILASLSAQEVSRMLDADTLRVESEDQVASFILRYIEERAWLSSAGCGPHAASATSPRLCSTSSPPPPMCPTTPSRTN
jgi:hypothetical protein